MKKVIFVLGVLLTSIKVGATEARFYFDDLKIKAGTSQTVTLKVYNDLEAKGFQLTITLPTGLTFVSKDVEQLGRLADAGYMVSSSVKNANSVLSIMGVNTGSRMESGDGDILSFNIQAAEDATLETTQIAMSGQKITLYDTANRNLTLENFNQDIKVYTTYTVTATPNKDVAGSIDGAGEYENDTDATLTATANEGYSFTKWSNDVTDNPYTFAVEAATTLTAEFTPITYTINYDLAGGALADGVTNPESYTVESDAITLANPTRVGYTFAGWTGADLTEATTEVTIAKGSTENRSYTATWVINQYTMTFKLENGQDDVVKKQDYNSELTAPVPAKTGYTFKGWDAEVPATITAEDKTFTAQWEINQYTMTFKLENGQDDVVKKQDYNSELTAPVPTKTGYTFKGWDAEVPTTIPAEDKTFTAQWEINQYTMTFKLENGQEDVVKKQDYNSELTAPVLAKTGYTFKGWDAEVPATIPAEDKTFTAQWQRNSYKLTWDVDGVKTVSDVAYEAAITKPEDPKKEGYTFAGWTPEVADKMPAEDVTYTAQFSRIIIELSEMSTSLPAVSENNVKVKVIRTIKANEWSTICLPFAMTTEQVKAAFGTIVKLGDFSGIVTSRDGDERVTSIKVNFDSKETIEANHPYIIKVEKGINEYFEVDGVKVAPQENLSVNKDEKDGKYNSFVGTYLAETIVPNSSLFLNSGDFWYSKGLNKMKAFRGYFDFYDILPSAADASSRISIAFDGETTVVSLMKKCVEDDSNNSIYTLGGQSVKTPKKGLYIVNGKKIYVK